jgi:hypothetical protein
VPWLCCDDSYESGTWAVVDVACLVLRANVPASRAHVEFYSDTAEPLKERRTRRDMGVSGDEYSIGSQSSRVRHVACYWASFSSIPRKATRA